eukprot:6215503-Lingulodinium_polyedra.AAC.1
MELRRATARLPALRGCVVCQARRFLIVESMNPCNGWSEGVPPTESLEDDVLRAIEQHRVFFQGATANSHLCLAIRGDGDSGVRIGRSTRRVGLASSVRR